MSHRQIRRTAATAGDSYERLNENASGSGQLRIRQGSTAAEVALGRQSKGENAMKYMLLIRHGEAPLPGSPEWEALSADEQKAIATDYQAVSQTQGVTPGVRMEHPETATTVRVENGDTLTTDGPFVAVKEALGGYLFFEADNLDAAIELAARVPAARLGGAVEVRPVKEAL
jgi:hypothetical protein